MAMATKPTVSDSGDEALAARLREMDLGAFRVEAKRMLADSKLTEGVSHIIFGQAEERGVTLTHELIRYATERGAHIPILVEGLDHIESVSDTGG